MDMKTAALAFVRETEGQDLIEYALLAATIGLGVVLAMQGLRNAISAQFASVGSQLSGGS
jgi:pilus assembly protein Flp/PilA